MKTDFSRGRRTGLAAALAWTAAGPWLRARADTYPAKPLRLVVPFPPGGPTDAVSRIIAADWQARLGQPVLVDNKSGAVGFIGHEEVRKSAPDGYTLLALVVPAVINYQFLGKTFLLPRDFTAIGMTYTQYNVLIVNPQAKGMAEVTTVAQLLAVARATPEGLSYTSAGNGSLGHLTVARLTNLTGVRMVHVPYRGAAPAINDVLAGQVPVMFADSTTAGPHVRSGKLRAIAVTSAQRVAELAQVPTLVEQGYAGQVVTPWYGLAAPAGTPADIVARLATALKATVAQPEVQDKLRALGLTPQYMPPDEFTAFVNREFEVWSKVIRDNQIVVAS